MSEVVKIKSDPKVVRAWTFYDWANSVYPLVISSAIFPVFYDEMTATKAEITVTPFSSLPELTFEKSVIVSRDVDFLGKTFENTEILGYVISVSFLLVSLISPLLSGIADYSGSKKTFLKIFCYLGATATMGLALFDPDKLELSLGILLLASTGFWASLVFYNAYLPQIAPPEEHDRISARGFSMGYLGGAILLILILGLGMGAGMPFKYGFVLTGIWWIGFSQFTYKYLPKTKSETASLGTKLTKGFKELKQVWREFMPNVQLRRFLIAFFLISMGVQTIMILAVSFAKVELGIPAVGLIASVLCIQFVGIAGSFVFARWTKKTSNNVLLSIASVVWLICCIIAFYITEQWHFYGLAALVGFIMGGTQSVTRSTYSQMLPKTNDLASYFSFYDVTEKIAIVIGTFTYGWVLGVADMRYSALAMGGFFLFAIVAFLLVPRIKPRN